MKVGFIGLGIMGKPMAENLIKDGYKTHVYDLNQDSVDALSRVGGYPCRSVSEVAENSSVIITMLPTAEIISKVLFSKDGIAQNGQPNTVIIDMSSVSPTEATSFSTKLKQYNMSILDAPVSGGEPKAIDGSLSIMVGGENEIFLQVEPVLQAMGSDITHVGPNGAGSTVKLANQIIVNTNIAAMSEAAVLASKAGVDLKKMYEAIRGGLAGSAVLDAKMTKLINQDFEPGGRIDINFKDLHNVTSAANDLEVPLPLTTQVKEIFRSEMANGNKDKDHSYLVHYFENLANHRIGRGED